jgi:hypothetical protein
MCDAVNFRVARQQLRSFEREPRDVPLHQVHLTANAVRQSRKLLQEERFANAREAGE